VMTTALELGRYSVASGCVGIIQSCLDNCVRFSTHRQIDSGLLADLPPARRELTDMIVGLRTARLLLREVGRLKDARDPGAFMAGWEAKYYASKVAHECTSAAVELFGGRGYRAKEAVGRLWRDAKVARNIEGPTYLQHSTIAGQFIGR
jgi:methoxymalonate biosynthesis protein